MTRLLVPSFRYAPAIGGAENHARRLFREIGRRLEIEVVTLAASNRTQWLRTLIEGERPADWIYEVDSRRVTAIGRWPAATRLALWLLAPGYHFPHSPIPTQMGCLLSPYLDRFVAGQNLVHNPFIGREAWSLAFFRAARRAGVPFVFTPLRHQRPLGWSSPAFRQLYAESDALIALTRYEADWLVARGAQPERVHVIGVGPLNDPEAPLQPARQAAGSEPFVLFLGQLHEYKGFRVVLAAARRLRDSRVRFVFAGPDVRGVAGAFRGAGSNVRYLGRIKDELRDSLLRSCLVLCVPSTQESFGGVVVEAWAAGRPVIAGTAPATRELVEDGLDGWTVAADPRLIAERISCLLDDPELASRMGRRGREKVNRRYSWPVIADAHLAVYDSVLRRPMSVMEER